MFGNYTKKNEKSRQAIIDIAHSIINDTNTPGSVVEQLQGFISQLQSQDPSRSKKVADVDNQIRGILEDIKSACREGNSDLAVSQCKALYTRAGLRPVADPKKAKKTAVNYSTEEVLNNMIAKMQSQSVNLKKEEDRISAALIRDPYNAVLGSQLEQVRAKAQAVQNQTNMLLDQNKRKAIMAGINAMAETERFMLADQSASDEEFQHALNKFSDITKLMGDRSATTQGGATTFYGTSVGGSTASIPNVQRVNYADAAGLTGGSANSSRVNYAQAAGLTGNQGTAAPMPGATNSGNITGGVPANDPSAQNLKNVFAALEKTIKELKIVDKYYSCRIDDATVEYNNKKEKLRELLIRRKTASAIDCVSLDSEIDNLNIELGSQKKRIARFASARTLNAERLNLANTAMDEKDINMAGDSLKSASAFIDSSPDIAMYIKNATEKRNDAIDEAGAISAVADAVDPRTTSVSGGRAYGNSLSEEKDEDKYSDLERSLGL